ncbi:MAG: cytochrome b N-terminal domain-containing protein [Candidatus Saccharibacteria bacterium]
MAKTKKLAATKKHPLLEAANGIMIKNVPSYGNKFFYSLGFLSMITFFMLILTGVVMTFFGPNWWLTNPVGSYIRSVHLWSTQAFVVFIILHGLIVFFTSGFKKPRRLSWVLGVLMLFVVLAETEFGYVLRGDFSSQWRGLQGADFYNGGGLGWYLNPLNYRQIYGVHIVIIPFVIISLLFLHYVLVRVLGIAKPYRKDVNVKTVPANHKKLFARAGGLIVTILLLAVFLPSPYIKSTTIQSVAQEDPVLVGKTLVSEFDNSSDTSTYMDNIDPYKFAARNIFIANPYQQYLQTQSIPKDYMKIFNAEPKQLQDDQLKAVSDYFDQDKPDANKAPSNPVMSVIVSLSNMAKAGLYEPALAGSGNSGTLNDGSTYVERFLSDTGVLEGKATILNITTDQYGMIREEKGNTPGAWWLAPIGVLNHTVLKNTDNGDRDAAIIFGSLILTLLAFPFIPYINQIPDKLKVYRLIWGEKKRKY